MYGNQGANPEAFEKPEGTLAAMTFPVSLHDHALSANFPMEGAPFDIVSMMTKKAKPEDELVANVDYTEYKEGIYVGYRHFDKAGLKVSYPFGYGLSYTEIDRAVQELKAFAKTPLLNSTIGC